MERCLWLTDNDDGEEGDPVVQQTVTVQGQRRWQAQNNYMCRLVSDLQPCYVNIHNKVVENYPLRAMNENLLLKTNNIWNANVLSSNTDWA